MLPANLRIYRIRGGWALVYDIRDADGERLRVLRVGGVYQSVTYLGERRFELPFEYYRAISCVIEEVRTVREGAGDLRKPEFSVLAIGGGGCSVPKHLAQCVEGVRVDVVEHDPKITKIARGRFFVDEAERTGRLRLTVADGEGYLRDCKSRYDAIVNDAFNGTAADMELLEEGVLKAARSCLADGGVYMINVVCEQSMQGAEHLRYVVDALKGSFAHVYGVIASDESFSDKDNFVLAASDNAYELEGAMEF